MHVMLAQMDRSTVPSSAPTQTRRGTPVSGITEAPHVIIPGAAGTMNTMTGSAGPLRNGEVVDLRPDTSVTNTLVRQEIIECAMAYLRLDIEDARRITINFKPQNAEGNLNSTIQQELAEVIGIPDLPTTLFSVKYQDPPEDKMSIYGFFRVGLPDLLKDYITPMVTKDGPLEATGDNDGNVYKLKLMEHAVKEFKEATRRENKEYWFHLIIDQESRLSIRDLLTATDNHIGQWGFKVQDHPDAFKRLPSANREQGLAKIHVEYEVDLDRVPLDRWNCYYFEEIASRILLDPKTYKLGKIWFEPARFKKLFGACNICGINTTRCNGHEMKQITGSKRPTAAENAAAARARIAQNAKKKFSFN